ncbi:hypothetical protein T4A_3497 [Trichinella pseudospiralis]|uniref:Uncharacterized protein n=2 Tax=Trichinella pseudospiralis TaxID=6337 RepID=A0A0V1DM18_TRIPS|nr:hypothetical protein T4A_3497 [Trichinella pseudospiralis]
MNYAGVFSRFCVRVLPVPVIDDVMIFTTKLELFRKRRGNSLSTALRNILASLWYPISSPFTI